MMVFNPVSLYGVYLGWQQYEAIFNACYTTGLVWLPFIGLTFEFMHSVAAPQGSTHHAADHAIKHYKMKFLAMVTACLLFVNPSMYLSVKGLSYKPRCAQSNVTESTVGDTGTTYDEVFADLTLSNIKVPLGFIIAQQLASGWTYGLMKGTACQESLDTILKDSAGYKLPRDLADEAREFNSQCFREAKGRFSQEKPAPSTYKKTMDEYGGEDDLNWMGSHTLRTLYYSSMQSKKPIPGFDYPSNPMANIDEARSKKEIDDEQLPEFGYPTCEKWWLSIRQKIVDIAQKTDRYDPHLGAASFHVRTQAFFNKFHLPYSKSLGADDFVAKAMLSYRDNPQTTHYSELVYTGSNNVQSAMASALVDVSQSIKSAVVNPVEREGLSQGLPVYQAMGYFLTALFAPLLLIAGGYRFSVCFALSAILFILTFLSYV